MDPDLVEKLEKWVAEHPQDADVPHINLSTQREFTLRGVLGNLKREKETGVALVDEEIVKVKDLLANWLER